MSKAKDKKMDINGIVKSNMRVTAKTQSCAEEEKEESINPVFLRAPSAVRNPHQQREE